LRLAAIGLLPPGLLFAVFIAFFDFAPIGDDWIWLGVGIVYFAPWYCAWCVGAGVEALLRRRFRPLVNREKT
jgi:hypothetical protein